MTFAGALMSNKLAKAETLAEATHPQFTTGAYGFGFQIGRPDEAWTYGHGRRRSRNERDSSRVSGVGPVGDRVVQPGQSFGFAHGRLAPRPHATPVVPTTGDAAVEKTRRTQVRFGTRHVSLNSRDETGAGLGISCRITLSN